jgi:hypothetical protein
MCIKGKKIKIFMNDEVGGTFRKRKVIVSLYIGKGKSLNSRQNLKKN